MQRVPSSRNPFGGDPDIEELIPDEGWPCQRLRLGYGLVLFFAFEVLVGQQLPFLLAGALLGLGITLLASAMVDIRKWRLRAEVAIMKATLAPGES